MLRLPPNPVAATLTGKQPPAAKKLPPNPTAPVVAPGARVDLRIGHLAPGGLEQLQQATEKASAPAVASYNKAAGVHLAAGSPLPPMKAADLRTIREQAAKSHGAAEAVGSLLDPVSLVEQGVHGAHQIGQGAAELAHGHLGHGASDVALGGVSAAAVLPFGRGLKGALGITEGIRSAEEAGTHVAQAVAAAKAEGYGVSNAKKAAAVLVHPGEVTPQTGGEVGKQVREALHGSGEARTAQATGYSAERGKRAAAAADALDAHSGVEAYKAAVSRLGGELPRIDFQGFKQFDQDALHAALDHVKNFPHMQTYEKITAQRSIMRAVGEGKVPTAGEQKLLERAFGREVTQQIVASTGFFKNAKRLGVEVLNVPRAVMASFDLSAPFRQGLVVGVTHPGIFFKNFAPMIKSAGSEGFYQAAMSDIEQRPTFALMQKAGLDLTDIGASPHASSALEGREEQFMSNLAERIPGIGHAIRASDRAYVGFLNKTRADFFDHLVEQSAREGHDVNDRNLIEGIARFVNSATGRGDLGSFQKHAAALNTLLFSPKLLASRINFLNPLYYAKLDPFARRQALLAARNLVGTMGAVLYLAKLGGAHVETDPRNANFGKIRIGNTRIDIAGGFQQPVRVLGQLFSGAMINSSTGEVKKAAPGVGGWGKFAGDVLSRFFQAKLAPVPSVVNDLRLGKDFQNRPFSTRREVTAHMIPLLIQDAYDLYKGGGALPAVGGYGLGLFGLGIQTYGAPKPKAVGGSDAGFGSGGGGGFDGGFGGSNGGFGP